MPLALSHNSQLGVRILDMEGRVTPDEVDALLALQESDHALTAADSVQFVAADADLSAFAEAARDTLRARFNQLHCSIDLYVVRRSLWVCPHPEAFQMAQRWLDGRHSRDGQGTEARLTRTLGEAGELFSAEEIAMIAAREGFTTHARFEAEKV